MSCIKADVMIDKRKRCPEKCEDCPYRKPAFGHKGLVYLCLLAVAAAAVKSLKE